MKGYKKNGFIILGVLFLLPFLMSLDYLVHWNVHNNKAVIKNNIKKNEYHNDLLSDEVFYENDELIYYTDRVIKHFNYKEENIKNITVAWENLSKQLPKDVNQWIVPIPNRIIFEEGYNEDKLRYTDYYNKLENNFLGVASVVDLRKILDLYKEEYIFYKTLDSITAQGAYYASREIMNNLGIDFYIPLDQYHEHRYRKYKGNLASLEAINFNKNSRAYSLLEKIPEEWTYFYLLPSSKNICKVAIVQENKDVLYIKQPTMVKSGIGQGSIISSKKFDWAIVKGEGQDENRKNKTLLFISDESGRHMLPYFANFYENVYYVNLRWNKVFGTEVEEIKDIFRNYVINDVIYAQNAYEMGDFGYSVSIKRFFQ